MKNPGRPRLLEPHLGTLRALQAPIVVCDMGSSIRVTTAQPSPREQTRAFYDRISHAYDLIADASERAIRDIGIQALGLIRDQRVLEVGYGTGHGLVRLAQAVGPSGHVHGVDISSGMLDVTRRRIQSAGLNNVSLAVADGRSLCFPPDTFDAAFMSFTLELFDSEIPCVLSEIRRVLRDTGRLGIVAMAAAPQRSAMVNVYQWMHRHWPHVVDCQPIDVVGVLQSAGFELQTLDSMTIWGLPVLAAVSTKQQILT